MINKKYILRIVFALAIGMLLGAGAGLASQDNLGVFQKDSCVEIKQTCSSCSYVNLSISYPNSTRAITNDDMASAGGGTWTYEYCNTLQVGRYEVTGEGDIDGTAESFATYFDITLSGADPNASNPFVSLIIIGLIFGIACVFLYLSSTLQQPGPKIFFLLGSFVFLIGSLAISYVVAFDSNLTENINSTITIMLYAFGLIFFVMFAYVMINQIIESLDLFRQNKGFDTEL